MKSLFTALAIVLFVASTSPVRADESVGTKMDNAASDVKHDVKKGARHAKRKMRKAAGKNTVGDDIKDGANDIGDDVNHGAHKVKNKLND